MIEETDDDILSVLKNLEWDISQIKLSTRRIEERLMIMDCHQVAFHAGVNSYTEELDKLKGRIDSLDERNRVEKGK